MLLLRRNLGTSKELAINGIQYFTIAEHTTDRLEWIDKAVQDSLFLDALHVDTFELIGISHPHDSTSCKRTLFLCLVYALGARLARLLASSA
jgi:hypothetical protein